MQPLTTAALSQACRIFMDLAYPGGPDTIPQPKRVYYQLPEDKPLTDFLPPIAPAEVCQTLSGQGNGPCGYAFRLGSGHFPFLKLKVQMIDHQNANLWVFMVDTHDTFAKGKIIPSSDTSGWAELQTTNRALKEKIERAFEAAGITTFNSLLRCGLSE